MKTSNSILLTAVTWNMESKNGMLTISYIPSNSILYPMFRFCEHKFHFKETMRTSRSKPFIQFKNFSRQQLKKNKPHAKQQNYLLSLRFSAATSTEGKTSGTKKGIKE